MSRESDPLILNQRVDRNERSDSRRRKLIVAGGLAALAVGSYIAYQAFKPKEQCETYGSMTVCELPPIRSH